MSRLLLWLCVAVLLGALPARAQDPTLFRSLFNELADARLGGAAWGDADADGDFDLALTGDTLNPFTGFYVNDGDVTFPGPQGGTVFEAQYRYPYNTGSPLDSRPPSPFVGCTESAAAWGDADRDGDVDLAVTGTCPGAGVVLLLHTNVGGELLFNVPESLPGVRAGALAWGDLDNDGDLDLALTGIDESGTQAAWVYENQTAVGGALTFVRRDLGLQGLAYGSAQWGDYDADGDLDLLLSGIAQPQRWTTTVYRNDGGQLTDVGADLASLAWSSAAWGDMDADGDLDLVVNGGRLSPFYFRGAARVYRNDGGLFTDLGLSLPGGFWGGVGWGDADSDGDLDLVLNGGTQPLGNRTFLVLENTGGGFTTLAQSAGVNTGTARFGDYDGDGDLDALGLGERSDGTRRTDVLRNEVAPPNSAPSVPQGLTARREGDAVTFSWEAATDDHTPTPGLTYNLRVGTLPGQSDVLSAMAQPESGRRLVPGTGNAGHRLSWTLDGLTGDTYYWTVQALDGSETASAFAVEEVFAADPNDTTPPAPPTGLAATASDATVTLRWTASTSDDVVRYLIFRGPPADPSTRIATVLAGTTTYVDQDVQNGTAYGYRVQAVDAAGNESALTPVATATPRALFVASDRGLPGLVDGDVAWADVDGDGDLDLAMAGALGPDAARATVATRLYRNDGATFAPLELALQGLGRGILAWGDADGDGLPDLAAAGVEDGLNPSFPKQARILRNDGGTFLSVLQGDLTPVADGDAAWADYDGDGDLDLLMAGLTDTDTVTRLYRNDGADGFTELGPRDTGNELPGVSGGSVDWGDYDSDGDPDLLLAGTFSGFALVRVYRNDGGFFQNTRANIPGVQRGEARWADIDDDGDLDLAVAGDVSGRSVTRLYRNDDGQFVQVEAAALAGGYALAWADVDGDGDPDLAVATDAEGDRRVRVYLNDAGDFNALGASTLPALVPGTGRVSWADVDGDGDPDLLVTGEETGGARIARVYLNETAGLVP